MKKARPVQIQPKAMAWVKVKASPYMNTPIKRLMVGAMYCIKPTIFKGSNFAQLVKKIRGVAVTAPAPIIRAMVPAPQVS